MYNNVDGSNKEMCIATLAWYINEYLPTSRIRSLTLPATSFKLEEWMIRKSSSRANLFFYEKNKKIFNKQIEILNKKRWYPAHHRADVFEAFNLQIPAFNFIWLDLMCTYKKELDNKLKNALVSGKIAKNSIFAITICSNIRAKNVRKFHSELTKAYLGRYKIDEKDFHKNALPNILMIYFKEAGYNAILKTKHSYTDTGSGSMTMYVFRLLTY